MIAVINYGAGNLQSVVNAFESFGSPVFIANHPSDLERATKIVLPGVGAFGDGMQNLRAGGWCEALNHEVKNKGKIFLGICLGMQLLATTGTENGETKGLNFVAGTTVRFDINEKRDLRVPHIGWNDVEFSADSKLFAGLISPQAFYFAHSYVLDAEDRNLVTGVCDHGGSFPAAVENENIFATQFHPEKSHKPGIALLKNFAALKSVVLYLADFNFLFLC